MPNDIKKVAQRLVTLREIAGMSEKQMAEAIGMDTAVYQNYESGKVDIPISLLLSVANYFDISMTELLTGSKAKLTKYSLVRHDKALDVERSKEYRYKELAYGFDKRKMEPLMVYVDPRDNDSPIELNSHEGNEFQYCLEGRYEAHIGGHIVVVEKGDSLYFDSKHPHFMYALDNKPAVILVVVC